MLNFIRRISSQSSIHGFAFISKKDLHILERIFWIAIISLSVYGTYVVFSGQLKRYEENPTVLSVEIVPYGVYAKPAFYVCTRNYTNPSLAESVIEKEFGIKADAEKYSQYVDFVYDILNTTHANLANLEKYQHIEDFENANFLSIAREMSSLIPLMGLNYQRVMTEHGICQSSSNYSRNLSPYPKSELQNAIFEPETCTTLEVCRATVTPGNGLNTTYNEVYVTSYYEILSGDDSDSVELAKTSIKERTVKIDEVVADKKIRHFKPKSRKCRFVDEPNSEYFDIYTQNLCKIDCRIKRAKTSCGCVPHFYSFPFSSKKIERTCNITELLCLARNRAWFNATECNCMNLCESMILTKLNTKQQNLQFDRMLTLDLNLPKTKIVRSVVFDFDDLIVGFGGSAALFLGFSFLCVVECVFICIETIINSVKS